MSKSLICLTILTTTLTLLKILFNVVCSKLNAPSLSNNHIKIYILLRTTFCFELLTLTTLMTGSCPVFFVYIRSYSVAKIDDISIQNSIDARDKTYAGYTSQIEPPTRSTIYRKGFHTWKFKHFPINLSSVTSRALHRLNVSINLIRID